MRLIFLCIQLVQVLSEALLAPPQNVHVQGDLVTWTPAIKDSDVIYTVQYKRFDQAWKDLPSCIGTILNYCNVSFTKPKNSCIRLRVQAKKHKLNSKPVEACSRNGDTCTPEVSLTVRPGSLTVNLSRNHSLALEHGGHAQHRVYYAKEGELLTKYENIASSVSFSDLEPGQRYCVKIEYILYHIAVGPESCVECVVILESGQRPKLTEAIAVVVAIIVLISLITVMAYITIFHKRRVKQWLQPPCEIPNHFMIWSGPGQYLPSSSSTAEFCHIPSVVETTAQ
ncbi:interferon gamma receptor 2 [Channa argus]|uniref:interferon gamma receptor 2 n=1 Tax=Channa argus TaxID=215402 RepID=UPI002945565D|nr:hypothetical protein Q8A73_010356 [Channa argus]